MNPLLLDNINTIQLLIADTLQEYFYAIDSKEHFKFNFERVKANLEAIRALHDEVIEYATASNGGSCHSTPKDESNLFVLDTVSDIQIEHSRTLQISLILASKYFNEKPEDKNAMLLFSNKYDDMVSLLDVIITSNQSLENKIKSLHDTLVHNNTNPQRPN